MPTQRDNIRQAPFLWYTRLLQFVLTIISLGVAGHVAEVWTTDSECNITSSMWWNVICPSLTCSFLLYMIAASGPLSLLPFWKTWVQIGADALFAIFWIAAAATSHATCSELCNACEVLFSHASSFYVWNQGVSCTCYNYATSKRSFENMLMSRAVSSSAPVELVETTAEMVFKWGTAGGLALLFTFTSMYGIYKVCGDSTAVKTQVDEAQELTNFELNNTESSA